MKQYKLINKTTNEESICSKVVVDGFDYYVVEDKEQVELNRFYYEEDNTTPIYSFDFETLPSRYYLHKVITTNNPNIDLPQVDLVNVSVDLAYEHIEKLVFNPEPKIQRWWGFQVGYNKSQESHPYSKEDMLNLIQSLKDYTHESHSILGQDEREPIEFLEIWESKQIKTLYYE